MFLLENWRIGTFQLFLTQESVVVAIVFVEGVLEVKILLGEVQSQLSEGLGASEGDLEFVNIDCIVCISVEQLVQVFELLVQDDHQQLVCEDFYFWIGI